MSDYPVINIGVHKARQHHFCEETNCKTKSINAGQKYLRIVYIDVDQYGSPLCTYKCHVGCFWCGEKSDVLDFLDKKGIKYHKDEKEGYIVLTDTEVTWIVDEAKTMSDNGPIPDKTMDSDVKVTKEKR